MLIRHAAFLTSSLAFTPTLSRLSSRTRASVTHPNPPPPLTYPLYLQPETYFVQNVVDLVGVRVGVRVSVSRLHEEPRL